MELADPSHFSRRMQVASLLLQKAMRAGDKDRLPRATAGPLQRMKSKQTVYPHYSNSYKESSQGSQRSWGVRSFLLEQQFPSQTIASDTPTQHGQKSNTIDKQTFFPLVVLI